MSTRLLAIAILLGFADLAAAQQADPGAARRLTLDEAVALALEHNHLVRIAKLSVDEKQEAKNAARGAYFPKVDTATSAVHLSDTQLIAIPAGGLGAVGSALIPPQTLIINQGGVNATTFGVGVAQPLTQLFKIKAANDVAQAEAHASVAQKHDVEDSVVLKVHQIYYAILVNDARRSAVEAKLRASDELQGERVQQVKYGSALDADLIESRAYSLQAKQELLSTNLQLSDLHMQFNDLVGLPLTTQVALDSSVAPKPESCEREECIRLALASHPELAEARAQVDKAESAVRFAKYQFIPDAEVFARYSWQRNVPFLANNFGTIGFRLTYDLFDGGRRGATVRERSAQVAQAKENLARLSDEVELRVQTAYNKLQRTREMVAVSTELLTLRTESRRVSTEQLARGSALRSQTSASTAQEFEARAALLQSQLDYLQAADEMDVAIGQRPR
jgi:outer membrane protein TolC